MAGWLDKRTSPPAKGKKNPGLPSLDIRKNLPDAFNLNARREAGLPNASLIYGMGSAALLVLSVYFLFTGMWLRGILVMLPAACLLGFALHFLRDQD